MSKNPEQWYLSQRYGYADHWYSVFGASDPVAGNTLDFQGDLISWYCLDLLSKVFMTWTLSELKEKYLEKLQRIIQQY